MFYLALTMVQKCFQNFSVTPAWSRRPSRVPLPLGELLQIVRSWHSVPAKLQLRSRWRSRQLNTISGSSRSLTVGSDLKYIGTPSFSSIFPYIYPYFLQFNSDFGHTRSARKGFSPVHVYEPSVFFHHYCTKGEGRGTQPTKA